MQKLILLAAAGGLGSLSRYGLAGLVHRFTGGGFPWGTFTVNALGCLLFGAIWGLVESRAPFGPEVRAIVLTGFMGAFTTFSTFIFETAGLMRGGQHLAALLNVAGQNILGLACLFLGLALAHALVG